MKHRADDTPGLLFAALPIVEIILAAIASVKELLLCGKARWLRTDGERLTIVQGKVQPPPAITSYPPCVGS
jgi:hypothetical protein